MGLSTFVLGLFVFLQSSVLLGWFRVDNKLIGAVGMVFVVILLIEAVLAADHKPFTLRWPHKTAPNE